MRNRSPVASHRARKAREGFVRVEVAVRREDAALVRGVATALADPAHQAEARALLRQRFGPPAKTSLKALLASAPFEGVNFERDRDMGRAVDL